MSHTKLTLFVSSTCYDLAQVRENISLFCEGAGINALVSEQGSFPVDPSFSTVENCLKVVRERADIFLLVVGGRYGALSETGKSITNLEYLEAQSIGIPKYVFVKRDVLALLPVWQSNPEADFSSVTDSPKLFEFISFLRNSGEVWIFPFDSALDLTTTLRAQLSYLFLDSLKWRKKLQLLEPISDRLDARSLKHFSEKAPGWEYLCLASLLRDRILNLRSKKLDLELSISLGSSINLDNDAEVFNWISKKMSDASSLIGTINPLFSKGVLAAVGAPGEPGDIERIEHFATRVAELQSLLLDWSLEFFRVNAPEHFNLALDLARKMASEAIEQIESYALTMYDRIDSALKNHKPGDILELTLTLTTPNGDQLTNELVKIRANG